jgi:hypothetical protein
MINRTYSTPYLGRAANLPVATNHRLQHVTYNLNLNGPDSSLVRTVSTSIPAVPSMNVWGSTDTPYVEINTTSYLSGTVLRTYRVRGSRSAGT